MEISNREQWFIDRIGKRVFRGPVQCSCRWCTAIEESGLVIIDRLHASCLCDMEIELGVQYFDSREDANVQKGAT